MKLVLVLLTFMQISMAVEFIEQNELRPGDVYIHKVDPKADTTKLNIPVVKYRKNNSKHISKKEIEIIKRHFPKRKLHKKSLDSFMFLNKLKNYPEKFFFRDYPMVSKKVYKKVKKELSLNE